MTFIHSDRDYMVGAEESLWSKEQMQLPGGDFHLLVGGDQSNGAYTLLRVANATPKIPTHVHRRDDESIYMIEGECTVTVADREYVLGPGGFVFMPKDVPHSVMAHGPCTQLNIIAPGGIQDKFIEEMSDMFVAGKLDGDALVELNLKYGVERPQKEDWFLQK